MKTTKGIVIDERGNKVGSVEKLPDGRIRVRTYPIDVWPDKWRIVWDTFDLGLCDIPAVIIA